MSKKITALIILDGFGERAEADGNAVLAAKTPNIDALKKQYPWTTIGAVSYTHLDVYKRQAGGHSHGHLKARSFCYLG